MEAVDVHAHWYPQPFLDLLGREGPAHGLEWRETPAGPQFKIREVTTGPAGLRFVDLDERLRAMDEQGVTVHILSLTQPMLYWAGRSLGERLSILFNDELARAHQRSPQRLFGLATLPMHEPDLARREIERAARLPGIRGAYAATVVLDRELSDESFFPIYEALEGLSLPLFLHPVFVIGEERLKRFYLTNLLGNPFETAIAASHLVFGGVLDRFPKLEVVLPHAGGAFPWLAGRLQRGWEKRPELRSAVKDGPQAFLRRFHYDTIGYSDAILANLVHLVGEDRVMMGSDYCFPIAYERPVEVVTGNPHLSDTARQAILAGNAARLLKL